MVNLQMESPTQPNPSDDSIQVEITGADEAHCFRILLKSSGDRTILAGGELEIYLHATQLVDLIRKCSEAHSRWMHVTTSELLEKLKKYAALLP
jgi:hypothetical protein